MEEKIKETGIKLGELAESFAEKRDESLSAIPKWEEMTWKKLKTARKPKKEDIVTILKCHDDLISKFIKEIHSMSKTLNPEAPGTEEEEERDQTNSKVTEETAPDDPASRNEEGKEDDEDDDEDEEDEDEEDDQLSPSKVCSFYLRGKCKYGRFGTKKVGGKTCPKKHPELCRKFSSYGTIRQFGCNKGRECPYYHRPLCKSSVLRHQCYNPDCQNHHLKNTRRAPPDEGEWQVSTRKTSASQRQKQRQGQKQQKQQQQRVQGPRLGQLSSRGWEPTAAKTEEDFCQRILDKLTLALPQLMAQEFSRQNQPTPSNFSYHPANWQLPPGMTLTQSARG